VKKRLSARHFTALLSFANSNSRSRERYKIRARPLNVFALCLSILVCKLFLGCLMRLTLTTNRMMGSLLMFAQFFFGIVHCTALITFERVRY